MNNLSKLRNLAMAVAAAAILVSCAEAGAGVNSDSTGDNGNRAVQYSSLWASMDSDSSAWNKATWSNGGMFNCGFKADHAYFSGGNLVLKLDNVSSSGKPYSSGEYRTNNTFSYGTYEVNMKAAKASGTVTSFFTYTGSPWDEIDVEILGTHS